MRVRRALRLTAAAGAAALLVPAAAGAADRPQGPERLRIQAEAQRADAPPVCDPQTVTQVHNDQSEYFGGYFVCGGTGTIRLRVVDYPDHGRFDVEYGEGYYVPSSGYTGPDSVTVVASNAAGSSAPLTIPYDVIGPAGDEDGGYSSFCQIEGDEPGDALLTHLTGTRKSEVFCFGEPDSITVGPVYDAETEEEDADLGVATIGSDLDPDEDIQDRDVTFTAGSAAQDGLLVAADVTVVDDGESTIHTLYWEYSATNEPPTCDAFQPAIQEVPVNRTTDLDEVSCEDPENDPLTLTTTGLAAGDELKLDDGVLTYRSAVLGQRNITVSATDTSSETSEAAEFPVDVVDPGPAPTCGPLGTSLLRDTDATFGIDCAHTDYYEVDSIAVGQRSIAAHGSVTIDEGTAPGSLTVIYHPDPGYVGTDGFEVYPGNQFDDAGPFPVALDVKAPAAGQSPAGPGPVVQQPKPVTPALPSRTQVESVLQAGPLAAALNGLGKAFGNGGTSATIGPFAFDTVTTASLTGSGAKASVAQKKRKKGKKKPVKLGSGKLNLKAGKRGTLTVKLNGAAKKALKKAGKLKATLKVVVTNPATGAKVTKTRTVTLKAKKTKKRK